ncbi:MULTISPECIES: sulfur carrier protein ThiS [Kocuria]|uniref:sulfur carrier protein ThiS n=1 Tax=Kocuria TaxID=57493 RepID=UPI00066127A1|nr:MULTISPECIES: sulfur carrier protein ThiS [Kocuria]MCT1367650.1 sulfur carrier protein ThiS [Rothia sp. p3-SID1597]RUQ21930.1 sulfur carrier protein ThiS [Kocuria sp. HSID16901]
MAIITVNDQQLTVDDGATIVDVVTQATGRRLAPDGTPQDGGRLGIAVSMDGAVVPRSTWSERRIAAGATLELVTAVQGG